MTAVEIEDTKVETVETVEEVVDDVKFTFDGDEYTRAKDALDDLDVLEPWEDGKHIACARALLGEAQWKKFRSKKRGFLAVLELLNAAFDTKDED
jgi:hypothetical protein